MNKKGIELSINFLVIVIISIVVLGFGVKFITDIVGGASDIQKITVDDLDNQISGLMCSSSDRVCFGFDTTKIRRGDFDVVGIKITNVLGEDKDFHVVVKRGIAVDKKGNEITELGVKEKVDCIPACTLGRKEKISDLEEKDIGLGFSVDENALSGKYTFDVAVCTSSSGSMAVPEDPSKCAGSSAGMGLYGFNKIYIEVP